MGETLPFKPAGPGPSSDAERRSICAAALALAERAEAAAQPVAAYLFDMAAITIGDELILFGRAGLPRERNLRQMPPMPKDPESLIEWGKRYIFDEPPCKAVDARSSPGQARGQAPGHDGPGTPQRRNLFRKLLRL